MRLFTKKHRHLFASLSIAGQGIIYLIIGTYFSKNAVPIDSWIDDRIPYVAWLVIFYVSWMPLLYIAFIYLGLTNQALYWRTLIVYNVAVTFSNCIFIVFPTYMPRPEINNNDDLFTVLVQFIYSNDNPVNCFPSIHCLTTYLLFITMCRHKCFSIYVRIFLSIYFWSIIASTVFIKQHALIDVAGGIILAEITYQAVYYIFNKQQKLVLSSSD